MINQFFNLSCYEEFEIQCTLSDISKINILKGIGYKIDDYYFFISNDSIFNWFDLNGNHIEDPEVLKELKAEHIPYAVSKCIIPNSVTHIGNKAFAYCYSLTSIIIPDSVTNIGDNAFWRCESLETITIPNSVTSIGTDAFYRCKSLTSITIPDSVTNIGLMAFFGCESLKEIIFKGKTLDEVKRMKYYPFGIEDENVFNFS